MFPEWPLEAIPCLENFGTATRAAPGAIFGLGSYFWTRYANEPPEPYLSTPPWIPIDDSGPHKTEVTGRDPRLAFVLWLISPQVD
jgi:hypothetical protein